MTGRRRWRVATFALVLATTSLLRGHARAGPGSGPAARGDRAAARGHGSVRRRLHRSPAHDDRRARDPAQGRQRVRRRRRRYAGWRRASNRTCTVSAARRLVLVYPEEDGKVTSIVGQGWAPKAVDVDWYLSRRKTLLGAGLDPAVVPGALHAALTVLERWGTMTLRSRSRARAIELRRERLPDAAAAPCWTIERELAFIERWPDNKAYWLKPDGSRLQAGETIRLPSTWRARSGGWLMPSAARPGRGRAAAIVAARDRFYKGDIAREMVAFLSSTTPPSTLDDFADFFARIEEPAKTTYRGYDVYKHGVRQPGPGAAADAEHPRAVRSRRDGLRNSADYLHTIVEAMKLAYADRDSYYADPGIREGAGRGSACRRPTRKPACHAD